MAPFYQSTHSLFIQASPEKVYESLTTWHLRAKWRKGIKIKWEGPSQAFKGQNVAFKVQGTYLDYTFGFKIIGLEPPFRIYIEYDGVRLRGRSTVEITPEEGGSRVAFHWMKVEPIGFLSRLYFTLRLGTRAHAHRARETLRMLKDYLENPPPKT